MVITYMYFFSYHNHIRYFKLDFFSSDIIDPVIDITQNVIQFIFETLMRKILFKIL
jgi:hypothetical protein